MNAVPLGDRNDTLSCDYGTRVNPCGEAAAWHLSWQDEATPAAEWENSLACQQHRDEAERRGWAIGWRHRTRHACGMPGSELFAEDVPDEDGWPQTTWCAHPFDADPVFEAVVSVGAVRVSGEEQQQ